MYEVLVCQITQMCFKHYSLHLILKCAKIVDVWLVICELKEEIGKM